MKHRYRTIKDNLNTREEQPFTEVQLCITPEEMNRKTEITAELDTLEQEIINLQKEENWTAETLNQYNDLETQRRNLVEEYNQITTDIENRYIERIPGRASENGTTIEEIIKDDIRNVLTPDNHPFFESMQNSFLANQKKYKDNPKIAKIPKSLLYKNFQNFYYFLLSDIRPQLNAIEDYELPDNTGTQIVEEIAGKYYKKPVWWDKKYNGTAPVQLSLDTEAERPVYTKPPTRSYRLQDPFTKNLIINPQTLYDVGQEDYKPRIVQIAHNYTADFSAQFNNRDITILDKNNTINAEDMTVFNVAVSIVDENFTRAGEREHLWVITETQFIRAIHENDKLMPTPEQKEALRKTLQKLREVTARIKLPKSYATVKGLEIVLEGAVLESRVYSTKDSRTGKTVTGYLFKWFKGASASPIFDYAQATGQIDTRPIFKPDYLDFTKADLKKLTATQHNSTNKTRVLTDFLRERAFYYENKPKQNGNIIKYQAIYERLGYDKDTPRQYKHSARKLMIKIIEGEISKLGTPAETSSLFYSTSKGILFNDYEKNPDNITLKKNPH